MKSVGEKYYHIRVSLVLSILLSFIFLLIVYRGPGEMVDMVSVFLLFLYTIMLIVALYSFKNDTLPVVIVVVMLCFMLYCQRVVFLYLFPSNGRYVKWLVMGTSETNKALAFLIVTTLALFIGFKIGEVLFKKKNKPIKEWFFDDSARKSFYIIATIALVIEILLIPVLYKSAHGRIWSDSLLIKVVLHFIVYHGIFLYVPMLLLLHPGVKRFKNEIKYAAVPITLFILMAFLTANKDAFAAPLIAYVFCKITMEMFWLKRKIFVITFLLVLFMGVMFPLHHAVKQIWVQQTIYAVVPTYEKESTGYFSDLLLFSARLGGVDWIAATMSEKSDELKKYVNMDELVKSAVNRMVPTPEKIFPDTLSISAVFPIVIRGLTIEQTKEFGEYPTLLGWLNLTMGYGSVIFMLGLGIVSVFVLRSGGSSIFKLLFLSYFIWDLYLGGDIIEETKAMLIYYIDIWVLTHVIIYLIPRRKKRLYGKGDTVSVT